MAKCGGRTDGFVREFIVKDGTARLTHNYWPCGSEYRRRRATSLKRQALTSPLHTTQADQPYIYT